MQKVTVIEAEAMIRDNLDAMRKEYTRMRDIAQKRVSRLEEQFPERSGAKQQHIAGYDANGEPIYKSGFQTLKNLDKMPLNNFAKAFSELSKFLSAKGSTVTGQKQIREKTIQTWQNQGLNLNLGNYNRVIKILEEMRKQKLVYGSDKAVELADSMLGLDDQQTNQWLDHLDILLQHTDELQEIPDLAGYDFDEILDMLGE